MLPAVHGFLLPLCCVLTCLLPVIFFCRFKPNEGVIIIGATNFPEALDKYVCLCACCRSVYKCQSWQYTHSNVNISLSFSGGKLWVCFRFWWHTVLFSFSALIRPGRFDMQVTVPKPDIKGRTEILNWYLKKIKVDPGVSSPLAYY